MKPLDLTNMRFGRLVANEYAYSKNDVRYWKCTCDCGKVVYIRCSDLVSQKIKSCGCFRKETATLQAIENSHNKFCGTKITSTGYTALYKPDHPNSSRTGYVLEHRFIMSELLGRPLKKGEIVHHINEDKTDNRAENLMVLTVSEHSSMHMRRRMSERKTKC